MTLGHNEVFLFCTRCVPTTYSFQHRLFWLVTQSSLLGKGGRLRDDSVFPLEKFLEREDT